MKRMRSLVFKILGVSDSGEFLLSMIFWGPILSLLLLVFVFSYLDKQIAEQRSKAAPGCYGPPPARLNLCSTAPR